MTFYCQNNALYLQLLVSIYSELYNTNTPRVFDKETFLFGCIHVCVASTLSGRF